MCGKDTPPFFSTGSHAAKGMGRYQYRDRAELLLYLIERDGAICRLCSPPHVLTIPAMQIDHIDGSENHNCVRNLRIVCGSRNIRLGMALAADLAFGFRQSPLWIEAPLNLRQITTNQRLCMCGRPSTPDHVCQLTDPAVSARLEEEKDKPTLTAPMRKNKKCEAPFNDWLTSEIQKGARFTYEDWANAGAHTFECSPETTKRYLDKRLNPVTGDLSIMVGGSLIFRKSVLDDMEDQN